MTQILLASGKRASPGRRRRRQGVPRKKGPSPKWVFGGRSISGARGLRRRRKESEDFSLVWRPPSGVYLFIWPALQRHIDTKIGIGNGKRKPLASLAGIQSLSGEGLFFGNVPLKLKREKAS